MANSTKPYMSINKNYSTNEKDDLSIDVGITIEGTADDIIKILDALTNNTNALDALFGEDDPEEDI